MMRRCVLELSRRQQVRTKQRPDFILPRKGFSSSSRHSNPPKSSGSAGKAPPPPPPPPPPSSPPVNKLPESGNNKKGLLVVGGVLISGAIAAAAYQNLYLNKPVTKKESSSLDISDKIPKDIDDLKDQVVVSNPEPSVLNEEVTHTEEIGKAHSNSPQSLDHSQVVGESQVEGGLGVTPQEDVVHAQQNDLPSFSQDTIQSDDQTTHSETSSEEPIDKKEVENCFSIAQSSTVQNDLLDATPISQEKETISEETETRAPSDHHLTSQNAPEASHANDAEPPSSLTDLYYLEDENERNQKGDDYVSHSKDKEDLVGTSEELKDGYISKDGNLVLDFLEAIHTAEKRQAELDAHILAEEKRSLKEKYEKELKDAKARELMYAETAAMLDKELDQERAKIAATVKTIQEKAEENLKMELERKDSEAEMQLKKVKELAQAELAAAIASEKASQIEKMSEANLNIDALCMAFYARSEEARQTHSVHKLALGALALEDALSKGLPIQSEISALHTYLEGIDKDSLLNLALSSLPEETLIHGTETQLQLNQKFDTLKPTLRHYSLIPPGGGGLLTHAVAHIAAGIKVKETDTSGDGIESVINRVESFLAEGKFVDAANALEGGVKGSQAEEFIGEWVKRAKNRAITEQALSLLQSYATAISVT